MKTCEFKIEGMTCNHCALSIEEKLNIDGIKNKTVCFSKSNAIVTFDEKVISENEISNIIDNMENYKVIEKSIINKEREERHLIIIGGGSAAFAATIQANELGIKVTMINDGLPIGGTCVNVGCVPSKNLIRASESLHKSNHNPFAGIKTSAKTENFNSLINEKRELVASLREQKYIDIIKDMNNFELIEGRAKIISNNSVEVSNQIIEGSHILIATGASPTIANIEGLSEVNYLTNEEAFELDSLPESIIVLGGSYIALEIAQMFSRLGSKVTILQRSSQILSKEHPDVGNELSESFKNEGIKIITNNNFKSVKEIDGKISILSNIDGVDKTFLAEKLIVATGRKANTSNMGLEDIGVELNSDGSIKVNNFLQTSVETIYTAGDVLGSNMFVYTAAYEGKLAVNNAFSDIQKETDYNVLPWVIFTDPQVVGVGLDEIQAKEKGINFDVALLPLSHVPRSIAAKDTRGFIKLIRDTNKDTLLGARIIAPEGSELLMEVAMAMKFNIKVSDLKEMLHPYLTLAEGIKLAAITFGKDVKKLSCCAT